MKQPTIYIMTNRTNSVLYVGVTGNLKRRIWLHKTGEVVKGEDLLNTLLEIQDLDLRKSEIEKQSASIPEQKKACTKRWWTNLKLSSSL